MNAWLISAVLTAASGDSASVFLERGFATQFDPWRGIELGGAALISSEGVRGTAEVGLRWRGERESQQKTESTWLLLHHLAHAQAREVGGAFALSVVGYEALFRRHLREGVLLLPLTPPVRVPFPLDIALHAKVLRFERRWAEAGDWTFEPLRLSLLFDPLRSASSRFHLGLGVTAAWSLHQQAGALRSEITPLTALALFFSFESDDGLWLARGGASGGWALDVPGLTFGLHARGELELSRVLLAINDQPVSLFVKASGALRDAGARNASEWTASAGLQLRLLSAR